jgi:hypothetical protein
MNVDNILFFVATSIGLYQIMNEFSDVYNMKNVEDYDMQYIVSGIIASSIWSVYQFRNGSNYYALYSLLGVILGLYTIAQIRRNSKDSV